MDVFIDAEDCIAGRLASLVAKELLKGRHVYIVNAEKAVVSGNPRYTVRNMREKVDRRFSNRSSFRLRRLFVQLRRFSSAILIPSKNGIGRSREGLYR